MEVVIRKVLKNWTELNNALPTLDEPSLKALLIYETAHDNRATFVARLHQRYNTVRVARERKELLDTDE